MRRAVFLLLLPASVCAFRVCGNYCGPNWCADEYISEAECGDNLPAQRWKFSGTSCADECCMAHDRCCGHNATTNACNTIIVRCLRNCNPLSLTCTNRGLPVPAGAIEAAMGIVEHWCCGSECPP